MAKELKTAAEIQQLIQERLGMPNIIFSITPSEAGSWDATVLVDGPKNEPNLLKKVVAELREKYDLRRPRPPRIDDDRIVGDAET